MISSQNSILLSSCAVAVAVGYLIGRAFTGPDSIDREVVGSPCETATPNEDCKMVLVVRNDLGMGKGKVAAQCAHAAVACYEYATSYNPLALKKWRKQGQAKITLQCNSEDELYVLQATAHSLGLPAKVICDAGRTQVAAGSSTVLGIGPGPKSVIDQVTGQLRLY